MRICITRSNKNSYSETFLKKQIDSLAKYAEVYPLYGGWLPEFEESGKLLNPKLYWLIHKVYKNILKKENNYFGNYGLKKFLKRNKIDVVLINYGVAGVKILPVCKRLNLTMVVHFHGFDANDKATLQQYEKDYLSMFSYSKAVIAVSNEMKLKLINLGAPPEKVFVNSCGVDTEEFQPCNPADNPPHFISIGRFTPKKAPDKMIKAFSIVKQKYPEAHLIMVGGDEGLLPACITLVKDLSLQDFVHFKGILNNNQVIVLLRKCRAFLQHSVTAPNGDMEGTPVSVLEASACALPVVSTYHGGIKEAVVHGETGFLVEEGDIEEMARYMSILLENPELAKTMGLKGRLHIQQHYELSKQIENLFHILEDAVSVI